MTKRAEVSDETNTKIDMEVRKFIDEAYTTAKAALKKHEKELHVMAEALIKYETIDDTQLKEIMDGKVPSAPKGWDEKSVSDSVSVSKDVTQNAVPQNTPNNSVGKTET